MSKHERVLGVGFLLLGLLAMVLLLFTLLSLPDPKVLREEWFGFVLAVAICALEILAGYALLSAKRWSARICLPVAVLALLSFPIGTLIGGYYLWYYFKFVRA